MTNYMEKLIKVLIADFLKENYPDKFGKLEYSARIEVSPQGFNDLVVYWEIPYTSPIEEAFSLIEVLAWIYSKQTK